MLEIHCQHSPSWKIKHKAERSNNNPHRKWVESGAARDLKWTQRGQPAVRISHNSQLRSQWWGGARVLKDSWCEPRPSEASSVEHPEPLWAASVEWKMIKRTELSTTKSFQTLLVRLWRRPEGLLELEKRMKWSHVGHVCFVYIWVHPAVSAHSLVFSWRWMWLHVWLLE